MNAGGTAPPGRNLPEPPEGNVHFDFIHGLIESHQPFTFVRFSDGEMEIIRNERLVIGESITEWRKGNPKHSFPIYDRKTFEPHAHGHVRQDLLEAAIRRQDGYLKGVPASHNRAVDDRDLMVSLNGDSLFNLTFADVFLNENYRRFMKRVVPGFRIYANVFVLGNFRMRPELVNPAWTLVAIPDDFFQDYVEVKSRALTTLENVGEGALILSSASSLSNIVGSILSESRPDLTLIGVGTSLHSLMGMAARTRQYHVDLEPWRWNNSHKKLRNRLARGYRLHW